MQANQTHDYQSINHQTQKNKVNTVRINSEVYDYICL